MDSENSAVTQISSDIEDDDDYYYESEDNYYSEGSDNNNDEQEEENEYSLLQSHFDKADLPSGVEISLPSLVNLTEPQPFSSSSKENPSVSSGLSNVKSIDSLLEFVQFRRFDTVDSFDDHHYAKEQHLPNKEWSKRINKEWASLSIDLPETIFVRVAEDRIDLLRAAMVGPAGTPYHAGLFFFDCHFTPQYPHKPPMVYYNSRGLHINPNLYENGKVCLSLLGTWRGVATENWLPTKSTMLQVLVSIQALILNERPFFNEPGYDNMYTSERGTQRSNTYNQDIFVKSLKTMVYSLRSPPQHFSDLVTWHFKRQGRDILAACKAYTDGPLSESLATRFKIIDDETRKKNGNIFINLTAEWFRTDVKELMKMLVACFSRVGIANLDEFRADPYVNLISIDNPERKLHP